VRGVRCFNCGGGGRSPLLRDTSGAPRVAAFSRAVHAEQANDTTRMRQELDPAVPFPKALEMRAALRVRNGDYLGALQEADALLATGRRGESRLSAHYCRGAALFKLGEPPALASARIATRSRKPSTRLLAEVLQEDILGTLPDSESRLPASVRAVPETEPASQQLPGHTP